MIPKKIHYCWFGGNPIPDKDQHCIESWKKYCPDYEIIKWDESNYNMKKSPYMAAAYKEKKWGFVPDYARFDIIYNEGGIYMDTDVEILKPLDNLLSLHGFMGFEEGNYINGGIGFGAEKGNPVMKAIRDQYDGVSFYRGNGKLNLVPSPHYITDYLVARGLKRNNQQQFVDDIMILPSDYFSPKELSTNILRTTEHTYSIHHYNSSWISNEEKKLLLLSQKINKNLGVRIGRRINKILQIGFWGMDRIFHFTQQR